MISEELWLLGAKCGILISSFLANSTGTELLFNLFYWHKIFHSKELERSSSACLNMNLQKCR
jgi:hypothetical protein